METMITVTMKNGVHKVPRGSKISELAKALENHSNDQYRRIVVGKGEVL